MIIEFLSSNSRFPAVKYNCDKLSSGKAEIMSARNFDAITVLSRPRAADFRSYLKMIGSLNPKVKNKQLHVSIMAKEHSRSKEELTEIAHKWLTKMGYGKNPYLIFFHNDNPNNHVHIVSVRVCKNRKSVPSRYEKFRASSVLNELIGFDPVSQAKTDAEKALNYGFTSLDQFMTLLKNMGYSSYLKNSAVYMVRHSRTLHAVEISRITLAISHYTQSSAANDSLKRVFELLLKVVSGKPFRHPSFWHSYLRQNFKSDLGILLKERIDADIIYHTEGKSISGFTVINHRTNRVHDGKDILDLEIFIRKLEHPEGYIRGDEIIFYNTDQSQSSRTTSSEPTDTPFSKNEIKPEIRRTKR